MKKQILFFLMVLAIALSSCVSKRYHLQQVSNWRAQLTENQMLLAKRTAELKSTHDTLMTLRADFQNELSRLGKQVHNLGQEKDSLASAVTLFQAKSKESAMLIETLQKNYSARQNELQAAYAEQTVLRSIVESQNTAWQALEKPIRDAFSDLGANAVNITREGGRLKLAISDKILFTSGSANLNKKAESSLAVLANALADKPNINLVVEGHTDNVPVAGPNFKDNWELSTARARAVNEVLSTKIAPQRLTISGKGEFDPVAPNTSEDERALNRRTEIYFDLKNSELEELISEMAIDIVDTRAKIITSPATQEKYMIDERSWIRYELNKLQDANKLAVIRNMVQLSGKPWKVNTGNNFFQAKVRNYRVVVVANNAPIFQTFDLVEDENKNVLTIELKP